MSEVLFSAICDEPDGLIEREVRKLEFTPDNLKKLWEKQRHFRTLMGREIHTFDEMVNFFMYQNPDGSFAARGLAYVIDDYVGIFWLSDIVHPAYAEVHYTFFDRRHRGRVNLVREAIKWTFSFWQLNRLYVRVGAYAPEPIHFVTKVGFKREGRLRKCMYYRGNWYDALCFGILKEEINKWEVAETSLTITSPKSKQD